MDCAKRRLIGGGIQRPYLTTANADRPRDQSVQGETRIARDNSEMLTGSLRPQIGRDSRRRSEHLQLLTRLLRAQGCRDRRTLLMKDRRRLFRQELAL